MLATSEAITIPEVRQSGSKLLALAKAVVDCAFQPIVETVSGDIYGYESLLRGHDRLEFDSPLTLIDTFARAGELADLEHFTTTRALAKFCALPDFQRRRLFLNLDHRLIPHGNEMIDGLLPYLEKNRISPSAVTFELSERFDNTSLAEFPLLIARMQQLGFRLAVDDFGTGHAEMKLLSQVDLDYLKIDRHLISGIDKTAKKRHLTKSVVDMAHVLGLRVIAEGVESESEFVVCRDLGVDLVQGWFIARPTVTTNELKNTYAHVREIGQRRSARRSLDEVLIRQQIVHLPALSETAPLDDLFELFSQYPKQAFFPVLNAQGEPRGIVQESSLKSLIYQPYGRDLMKNKVYSRSIPQFIDPAPVVNVDTDAHQMMTVFSSSEDATCLVLTENNRYAGVISAASLVKIISEKQLRLAQDQNPLTGLPGNQAIRAVIEDAMSDGETVRHLCYCDFDNFKPFNDHYGFQHGDQAIALFARLMKRHFYSPGVFLGHVGGDDFFAGVTGWTRSELEQVFQRLLADFDEAVADLYCPEDRERGYISAADRRGEARQYSFIRCSTGVLEIPQGRILGDAAALSARIAYLKKSAKHDEKGLVFESVE